MLRSTCPLLGERTRVEADGEGEGRGGLGALPAAPLPSPSLRLLTPDHTPTHRHPQAHVQVSTPCLFISTPASLETTSVFEGFLQPPVQRK